MSYDFKLEPVDKFHSTTQLTNRDSDMGLDKKSGCCGGRSSLEKALLFLVILTVAAAAAACVAIAILIAKQDLSNTSPITVTTTTATTAPPSVPVDDSICVTPGCVAAAARVNNYIDDSVHPCDNFFEYACGNWIRKHPIPQDRSSFDTFGVLRDELEVTLKGLLEAPSTEGELPTRTKAKYVYRSCVNESLIESLGLVPLEKIYTELVRWPFLDPSWDEADFDLVGLLVKMRRFSNRPLIYQTVSTDIGNSSARTLLLDQPGLNLPGRDYYNETRSPKAIPALAEYFKNVALAFGAKDAPQLDIDIQNMINFEKKVAEMTIPSEERRDAAKLYNKFTIAELYTNISDKFDWHRYLNGIMNASGVDIPVDLDEQVIVQSPVYLSELIEYLEIIDNRTKANYMMGYMLSGFIDALPAKVRDIQTAFNKVLFGTKTARARWRTCVATTTNIMGDAVGRMFVDSEFDEEAKDIALSMISDIRTAFNTLLADADWMDDPTRDVAKEKAEAIGENIGYSDSDIKNDTNLEDTYKDVDYQPDIFLENVLSSGVWGSTRTLNRLREPVDKTEWSTTPAVVNAFYSPSKNRITFPAGIMQPPFFSKSYPKSMNFGGIGMVIGHEITHGFDDQGRQFDKNGEFKQWWSPQVIEAFKQKAQCLVDQYSKYTVPEANMNLNGINTQGENIADNGGIRQSFTAYREWVKSEGKEEPRLPGVDLDHNKLFFVNFAQIWCGTMRRENAIQRILTGVHSPGRFRVIGSLQNSKEFSDTFDCASSSDMNPKDKCKVW